MIIKNFLILYICLSWVGWTQVASVQNSVMGQCEDILSETQQELRDYIEMLYDTRSELKTLQESYETLRVEKQIIVNDYTFYKDWATMHIHDLEEDIETLGVWKIYSFVLSFILLTQLAWWMAPRICYYARLIIGAGGACFSWLTNWPSRIRSTFRANSGTYEEIPMANLTREAMLPNSPIVGIEEYDRCIFKVYVIDSEFPDRLHFSGLGFWSTAGENVQNPMGLFMTASHVLPENGEIMLRAANREDLEVKMPVTNWTKMEDYDVAYYKPPQKITTTLGLRKAKVMRNILREKSVVVSVFGKQVGSMGPLKPLEKSIYVNYEGSSTGGFSGSPYMSGRTVCGLHIGSSKESGMGIDVAFLSMKLARSFKEEDSDDWVMDEIEKTFDRGEQLDWMQYGLDDVVVTIKGKDFFYDYYDFQGMVEEVKMRRSKGKKKWREEKFSDVEGLPKNFIAPTPALVVGAALATDVQIPNNPKLQKLSDLPQVRVDTTGPQLTLAQLNEALQSMLKSMNDLGKKLESQGRVIEKLSYRAYGAQPKKPGKQAISQVKT